MDQDFVRSFEAILIILGFIVFVKSFLRICFYILSYLRVGHNVIFKTDLTTKYGKWAVVTGCTDGIGLAYSKELARRGLNLVLISRSIQKLENVAKQLAAEFQVQTRVIKVDFSHDGREIYQHLDSQLQGVDIGILVNNVGVIYPYPMPTEELSEQLIWDHVMCNVHAATMMTSLILPGLKSRKRGAIVNVASTAALSPLPYLNVYSATKAYLEYLSRGLAVECKGTGVSVQTLVPSFINTKMINFSSSLSSGGLFVPTAETYAKHALATLGVCSHTTGYLPHGLKYWFLSLCPDYLYVPLAGLLNTMFRKEYEKTQADVKQ